MNVGKAGLLITASNTNKTYGELLSFAGTEFTTEGLTNSDTVDLVELASDGATNTAAFGTYDITVANATGFGLTNYTLSYSNGTLNVGKAGLLITASNTNKTYGELLSFAGTEFTTEGLTNNDTVDLVELASDGATNTAPFGSYDITAANASGTGLTNYTLSYSNGTLNVGKAGLLITANNTNKTYGELLSFAGTEFTTEGLTNSDTVDLVELASDGATNTAAFGTMTSRWPTPAAAG